MFLQVLIYRDVASTHSSTQKDITELKQRHAENNPLGTQCYTTPFFWVTQKGTNRLIFLDEFYRTNLDTDNARD